jgi:hypothetical protein
MPKRVVDHQYPYEIMIIHDIGYNEAQKSQPHSKFFGNCTSDIEPPVEGVCIGSQVSQVGWFSPTLTEL